MPFRSTDIAVHYVSLFPFLLVCGKKCSGEILKILIAITLPGGSGNPSLAPAAVAPTVAIVWFWYHRTGSPSPLGDRWRKEGGLRVTKEVFSSAVKIFFFKIARKILIRFAWIHG